ncbi:MAG: thiamine phosphate synthase [Alphaproteobacteria bacterium]|nr:thiamine phosphate synthase [Alphaproteobacteria bacterium]
MAPTPTPPATQLYLVLELAGGEPSLERLAPLFDARRVPSLLIVPDAARKTDPASLEALIAVAQHSDVAVLIADDVALAADVGADGVHIYASGTVERSPVERYRQARERLGANAIIGVDAGASRHDAMALGEAGADYIAFGPLGESASDEAIMPLETQFDIVSWWADIFEIPVVALDIPDDAAASRFAAAGADFVARKVPVGMSAADLRDWLERATSSLKVDPIVG